jgi:hypothetical protein
MQLNPELPDTDVDSVRGYLQAYLCLEDWLRMRSEVDLTRRLTFFADPFPKAYARTVVDAGYSPNLDRLIDDYLDANPTRNRSLDMLPLFCHLDEDAGARARGRRARQGATDAALSAAQQRNRPPRLGPERCLGRLAGGGATGHRPQALALLCGAYAEFLDSPLERLTNDWADRTQQWLDANPAR